MRMIKLLIKDYTVKKRVVDQEKNINEIKEIPYNVKQSMAGILYHSDLRLSMKDAINRKPLADSIENCKEDFIYVTKDDFLKIKEAFEKISGFGRDDLELLERIGSAVEVDVNIEESKK